MNNSSFSGDESLVFIIASAAGLFGAWRWYDGLHRMAVHRRLGTLPLVLMPLVLMAGLLTILLLGADPERVARRPDYILLFLSGGLAWLWLASFCAALLGVSFRDDALERRNPATVWAVCGALIGGEATYALSNIGTGSTIWTTLIPALVAFAAWLALWLVVELLSRSGEAIAIDRDRATGVRHGLYLVASGLVLGRAMVGDWLSWSGTFVDFARIGWPALLLAASAVMLNRWLRPRPDRPQRSVLGAGLFAGGMLVAAAGLVLLSASLRL